MQEECLFLHKAVPSVNRLVMRLIDSKLVQAPTPQYFIADRPKADLLFWSVGDFRCGVSLFMVILVIC